MIVIADTSPLHYLILLEHTEILQHLYGRVIIPEAVVRELQAQRTPEVVRRWITSLPQWLQVRHIAVPLTQRWQNLIPANVKPSRWQKRFAPTP